MDCPLRFHAWKQELASDQDRDFILDGLRYGFKLIPESNPSFINDYESDNYSSATCPEFKPDMGRLFSQELTLGRISQVDIKPRCVHPMGRVPKEDSGESRPITDCSHPYGSSLNVRQTRFLALQLIFRQNAVFLFWGKALNF